MRRIQARSTRRDGASTALGATWLAAVTAAVIDVRRGDEAAVQAA